MLESAVGRDVIKAGLTRYLEEHKFSTAVTNDLWESVEEAWTEHRRQRRDRDRYVRNGSGAGGSNTTANPGTASSAVLNAISDTVIEQINMVGSQNGTHMFVWKCTTYRSHGKNGLKIIFPFSNSSTQIISNTISPSKSLWILGHFKRVIPLYHSSRSMIPISTQFNRVDLLQL